MDLITIIGILAGIFTTGCWLPQVIKILQTRDVEAISLATYAAFSTGVALWLAYGVMIHAWPIIIANSVTLVLSFAIVGMKLWYGRKNR